MCKCINVEMGSYDNQECLLAPSWSSKYVICVDSCLSNEIEYLWSIGIVTGGCCCGHNIMDAFIQVYPESIQQMKDMGYKLNNNPNTDIDECFYPKTKLINKIEDTKIEEYYGDKL